MGICSPGAGYSGTQRLAGDANEDELGSVAVSDLLNAFIVRRRELERQPVEGEYGAAQ